MSNLHIQEFIFELEERSGKQYTDAERDRLKRNLKDCDLEHLKNILYKKFDKLPPVKDVISGANYVKTKEKSEGFDGCDSCEKGYIRAYNIWLNRKEGIFKPVAELDRIAHPGMLIPELNLYAKCPCTKQGTIDKLFDIMDGLFVSRYQHYELLYVSLWSFANSYLPGKSFPDFDNFNPFKL